MSQTPHYATAPEDRIPFPQKAVYGFGAFVNNLLAAAIGGMVIVLNLGLGMNPALVGLLSALPRLTDAITDPLMGYASDNTRTRWGRRRPFIFVGAISVAIVFTLLHSVVWPVALNTHTGFLGVSDTQRMVGRNYGLRGIEYVAKILIPAAFPSILTGLRIGWAYSWRTLIAAELVFGGSIIDTEGTASGGLGWFIFANQMDLQIPHVFAGLFSVILVGVLVENVVFRKIEERTVARWGMQIQ